MLATCALYSGDMRDWNRARAQLMALRRKRPESKAAMITEAALGGVLYLREAPDWLQKGRFEAFPACSYPALFYLYAKWLLMEKRYSELLTAVGPMIVSVRATGALLSELYLHLIAGAADRIAGEEQEAQRHIEIALTLALPDGLYGVLAEYRRQLGKPLDDALKRRAPAALASVREVYDHIAAGFTSLHNAVTGDVLTNELTLREYEIAALALHGQSNAAIARRIGVRPGSVKVYFNAVYQKLGVSGREELGKYIL